MLRRLLCRLGVHGPAWFGHGLGVSSQSNYSLGPGHRRCNHCGAEWGAYEAVSNGPYRRLAWERLANTDAQRLPAGNTN